MGMAGKWRDIIAMRIMRSYAQTACTRLHAHVPCEIRSQYSAKSYKNTSFELMLRA